GATPSRHPLPRRAPARLRHLGCPGGIRPTNTVRRSGDVSAVPLPNSHFHSYAGDMHSPSVLPESAPPAFETTHSAQSHSVRPGPAQPGPDTGWGIVLRHDLDSPAPEVWRRLLADWLPLWLGVDSVPQMVGAPLRREGRGRGRVVGCHMGRRVRRRRIPSGLAVGATATGARGAWADGLRGGTSHVLRKHS